MNAWVIKKAGREEYVCWDSPVPEGYVWIGCGVSVNCPKKPNSQFNQKIIKIPGKQEYVCWDSPIPQDMRSLVR